MHRLGPTLFVAFLLTSHISGAESDSADLFNGRDLDGWTQRGGKARYSVEDGAIVGNAVANTPNSFLCTNKSYGDFILEYEFKVDPRLNSGVQIRSNCIDEETRVEWQGKTLTIPAGRVHGYQVEIDPDPTTRRMWTAGIYDEGRRAWLYPAPDDAQAAARFSEEGQRVFKQNGWNHVRVAAVGDSIKTWLNGELRAELKDSMTLNGFIGLQVHEIYKDSSRAGAQVRWRNLKLREIFAAPNTLTDEEIAAGWRLLWDGTSSAGWRSAKSDAFPAKGWEIKDGVLSVLASGGAESASGGDIVTRERFSNFELQLEFKITPGANSGIKYFCQPDLDPITGSGAKAATGSAIGLEYQILDDARHPDAKLGRDGNRTIGSLYDLLTADAAKMPRPPGEWNHARIVVKGQRVEHWLNGMKVVAYDRGSPRFRAAIAASKYKNIPGFGEWADGHILLQDHGDNVSFQSVKIRVP